jgi:biopolymer transport protein ExbB
LGGQAALRLAEPVLAVYEKVALVEPLQKQLKLKKARLEEVLAAYATAAEWAWPRSPPPPPSTPPRCTRTLAARCCSRSAPQKLNKAELEQYDVMLEEQAFPFEEKAIELFETNARRTRSGLYDSWVQRSLAALAQLKPVRYGKTERGAAGVATAQEVAALQAASAAPEQPRSAPCSTSWASRSASRGSSRCAQAAYEAAIALDPQALEPQLEPGHPAGTCTWANRPRRRRCTSAAWNCRPPTRRAEQVAGRAEDTQARCTGRRRHRHIPGRIAATASTPAAPCGHRPPGCVALALLLAAAAAAPARRTAPTSTAPRSSATANCPRCCTSCPGRSRCPAAGRAARCTACWTKPWRRWTARSSAARSTTARNCRPAPPTCRQRPHHPLPRSGHLPPTPEPPRSPLPMNTFNTVVKFFVDCGPFLYPSLLMMALGLAIAIERFIFLNRARSRQPQALGPGAAHAAERQVQGGGRRHRAHSESAIGKIVSNGLQRMQSARRREDIDNAMEEGMMEIVPRLEKRTHYIATFANTITLVGLLGTIIGLIKGFTAVAAVNPAEKAEMLSASISVAMNNTAFALMVAIPFLLIHAFLQARASEIVDSLEAAKITFLNLVQRLAGDQLTTRARS